jgi:hypothetical protein
MMISWRRRFVILMHVPALAGDGRRGAIPPAADNDKLSGKGDYVKLRSAVTCQQEEKAARCRSR